MKILLVELLIVLCERIKKVSIGIESRIKLFVCANPISHDFSPYNRMFSQNVVSLFKLVIKNMLGIVKNCVKKMRELRIKKSVRIGAKIKFPTMLNFDNGNPAFIKIGRETIVTINCA